MEELAASSVHSSYMTVYVAVHADIALSMARAFLIKLICVISSTYHFLRENVSHDAFFPHFSEPDWIS